MRKCVYLFYFNNRKSSATGIMMLMITKKKKNRSCKRALIDVTKKQGHIGGLGWGNEMSLMETVRKETKEKQVIQSFHNNKASQWSRQRVKGRSILKGGERKEH